MVRFLDPTVFKRFLSQALTASKKQATQDRGVAAINPGFCWISCQGEVRSLTFDVVGPALSLDAQRKQNATRILELGKQYAESRASLAPDETHAGHSVETLSRLSMEEGICHVQDDKSLRLKDILKFILVVQVDSDTVEVRGI